MIFPWVRLRESMLNWWIGEVACMLSSKSSRHFGSWLLHVCSTGSTCAVDPSGKRCSVAGDDFEAMEIIEIMARPLSASTWPHRPLKSQSKRKQGSNLGHEWPWYVGEDVRKWWNQGKKSSPTGWRNPLTSWSFAAMDAKITTQAGGIYVQVLPNWRLTGGLPIFLNLVLCHSISMTKETRDASRSRICARTSAAGLVNQPSKPLVNCKPTWENRIWVEKPVYSLQVPSGKLT